MGLETAATIVDLNSANPVAGDNLSTADDHLRLIKTTLVDLAKKTFHGAVTTIAGTTGTAVAG